jgi:hypothetical protein
MVKRVLEVFDIPGIVIGYDIACGFQQTLLKSSLGPKVTERGLRCVLGTFHGYGHNRSCFVKHQASMVGGMGLEDFEGCEPTFKESNSLASTTRHASQFHRHQAIEEFFAFYDEDKYAALGMYIQHSHHSLTEYTDY